MLVALALALVLPQQIDTLPPRRPARTIAVDERLAADAGVHIGDRVVLSATPGIPGDTMTVAALVRRGTDPAEVARGDYRVRVHLGDLQQLIGYGDRVDRFAVGVRGSAAGTNGSAD
jgi:hypothetical protein